MNKKNEKQDRLDELSVELQCVRRDSLAASRRGDFRTVARLTGEAARINRTILAIEGGDLRVLEHARDKFFNSNDSTAEIPIEPLQVQLEAA